jgi:cell division control protein 24
MGEEGGHPRRVACKTSGIQGASLLDAKHSSKASTLALFKVDIPVSQLTFTSDTDMLAAEHQKELSESIAELLASNQSLSPRLMNLEYAFEVQTIVSKRQSLAADGSGETNDGNSEQQQLHQLLEQTTINDKSDTSEPFARSEEFSVPTSAFEDDLDASRVYCRAQRDTMDFSFRGSIAHTNAWSVFSTLSDVSILSAIIHASPNMSLYEGCLDTKLRLPQVPGFQEHLREAEDKSEDEEEDPLMFLIRVFRRGVPLLTLFESVPKLEYLTDTSKFERDIDSLGVPKAATQRFIDVMGGLRFRPYGQCFEMDDLMGDDSSGFMKVGLVYPCVLYIPT